MLRYALVFTLLFTFSELSIAQLRPQANCVQDYAQRITQRLRSSPGLVSISQIIGIKKMGVMFCSQLTMGDSNNIELARATVRGMVAVLGSRHRVLSRVNGNEQMLRQIANSRP